jgi:hypothetical protein
MNLFRHTAEEVGFEPTRPFDLAVFKTARFDHSRTPPHYARNYTVGAPGVTDDAISGAGVEAVTVWVTVVVCTTSFLFFRKRSR